MSSASTLHLLYEQKKNHARDLFMQNWQKTYKVTLKAFFFSSSFFFFTYFNHATDVGDVGWGLSHRSIRFNLPILKNEM